MSSFTDFLVDEVLDHVFRNSAYTPPSTVYLALFTTAPTDAGGGTEASGASYARQEATFGAASGGAITNTSEVVFTASGGTWDGVEAVGVFDASTSGNMLAWDDITSTDVGDGDAIRFPAGELDITLD